MIGWAACSHTLLPGDTFALLFDRIPCLLLGLVLLAVMCHALAAALLSLQEWFGSSL